jgi:serine/threonine protein kinase
MFCGFVPFKGIQQNQVYRDIKERKIGWPERSELETFMSKEAEDIINRMIQLEPQHRLGHNLESLKMMKQHPFFDGINFAEVSSPGYKGIKALVDKILP